MIKIIVNEDDANQTLIKFLQKVIDKKSKINIHKLIRTKKIRINNILVRDSKVKLVMNDQISIYDSQFFLKEQRDKIIPTKLLPIVQYEDENILVVVKDHNMLVHNEYGSSLDNIVKNYLVKTNAYDPKKARSFKVSHVHRLDKLTKGLVIYAKNKKTLDALLSKIDQQNYIEKFYLIKCEGNFDRKHFIITGYIKHSDEINSMVLSSKKTIHAKKVLTIFDLVKNGDNFAILKAKLVTGRKNQIRASLQSIDRPIVNDFKYGAEKISDERMIFLFAYKIVFNNFSDHLAYLNGKIIKLNIKL